MPGGGNISATKNLILYIEKHKNQIQSNNTIIVLNITGLNRWDLPCHVTNLNANKDLACVDSIGIAHPSEGLGLAWITKQSRYGDLNIDHVDVISALSIIECLSYLELNSLPYFFMVMASADYESSPDFLKKFLNSRNDKWVKFNQHIGMFDYVKSIDLITNDNHPTVEGHRVIANHVIKHLKNDKI
jgi:hypothetical protein